MDARAKDFLTSAKIQEHGDIKIRVSGMNNGLTISAVKNKKMLIHHAYTRYFHNNASPTIGKLIVICLLTTCPLLIGSQ